MLFLDTPAVAVGRILRADRSTVAVVVEQRRRVTLGHEPLAIAILDFNQLQQFGWLVGQDAKMRKVLPSGTNPGEKFAAFGWNVFTLTRTPSPAWFAAPDAPWKKWTSLARCSRMTDANAFFRVRPTGHDSKLGTVFTND